MARTDVDLANAALAHLTRGRLRNLDGADINTVETKENMQQAKEEVIEEYNWPECRVVSPLVLSVVEAPGWAYTYALPGDAVRVWYVGSQRGTKSVPFERGMSGDPGNDTQYIFTDQELAYIRYGSSRTNIARFSAQLFDLIGLKLACLCCMPIAKDAKLMQVLDQKYERKLSKVKTLVANSEPEVVDIDFIPETILVRSQ